MSIERAKAEDQEAVLKLINALIVKAKVEGTIRPFEKNRLVV